jgi:hypothetical protein
MYPQWPARQRHRARQHPQTSAFAETPALTDIVVPFEPQHAGERREPFDNRPEGLGDLVANGVPEVEQVSGNDQGRGRASLNPLGEEAEEKSLIHIIAPAQMKIRNYYRGSEAKISHE